MNNPLPQLSIVLDNLGFYYDEISLSVLDPLLEKPFSEEQALRAQTVIDLWRQNRVSKFNHAREYKDDLPDRYVLLTDQTLDDINSSVGPVDPYSLNRLMIAALDDNPDCVICLYAPDKVFNSQNPVTFDKQLFENNSRIRLLTNQLHMVRLIENAEVIYTATSFIGFEGLLWGKQVHTTGAFFYSGKGLIKDEHSTKIVNSVSLNRLVYAVLIEYYQYIDPETTQLSEIEGILNWLGLQRCMRERFPECIYAFDFSFHKKPVVCDYFQGCEVLFCDQTADIPEQAIVACWSRKSEFELSQLTVANTIRLEDGFIRSVGLGADLIRPLSWVMDKTGIYFDSTQPSDLENLLLTSDFNEKLLNRARDMRKQLVTHALTKYNVGSGSWQLPISVQTKNQTIILVPGQVESDASIAYGAPDIKRNIDLLRIVQEANPEAYIIYKPHPDVVAGLRYAGLEEDSAAQFCDEVLVDVTMGELLPQIDEVHTLTSLTGFEALLRGKKVTCYGQPFYSGWGLTEDIIPVSRRGQQLSLDHLVAGALILYPAYISRTTGKFTTPERALEELLTWREQKSSQMPIWRKLLRWYLQWTKAS